jgi:hypothetical protein
MSHSRLPSTGSVHPAHGIVRIPGMHLLIAALSMGSAAIHLAAGSAHVEALGDLGLGFYWAALFQAGIALGVLRAGADGPGPWLWRIALAGSLAISATWLVSRTVGLPLVPGGAEPVGTADLVATVLQLLTGIGLVAWSHGVGARISVGRPPGPGPRRGLAGGALIAALAVIALSSSIAVADAATGHAHAPGVAADHGHDAPIVP